MLAGFEQGGHGAAHGQAAAVEGVHQLGGFAFLEADGGAARLEVVAHRAAGDLAVGAGAGQPHFQVKGAGGGEAHVPSAEIDAAVGQLEGFQHGFGVGGDLLVGGGRLLGCAEPIQLHLVELVQADQAAGVAAVAAGFAAEAGGIGGVAQGKLLGGDQFIAMQRSDGHLGGGGEPEVVIGAAEALLGEFGQLARTGEAGTVHQDRRHHLAVTLGAVQVEHEVDQGPLQPGAGADQGDEAALGDPHGALGFKQAQPLADLPVLLETLLHPWATPALDLHVVGLGAAIRGVG